MKISFVRVLITLVAMISAFNANAQSDYVITVKGDSIPCSISTPLLGKPRYKVDPKGESKKIIPEEIREYYISWKDLRERSVHIDSSARAVFLAIIEKGRIGLYELVNSNYNGTTTTEWYVGKGSDYVVDLKTNSLFLSKSKQKRKDILGEMLKDNKAAYDRYIAEDKFSFKQIQNLVHLYNTGQMLNK